MLEVINKKKKIQPEVFTDPLATSWEELTHWKRLWCWEVLRAGGEGDARGWDGWMASLTQRTWVWVNSGSLWWTGRPGVLWFMGSQRLGHDWVTELNWRDFLQVKLLPSWHKNSCLSSFKLHPLFLNSYEFKCFFEFSVSFLTLLK